jgi:methylated-DNA-protein-cysteine methyltransferase-like protein
MTLCEDRCQCIHAVVQRIPAGVVATYGQVARLAGLPGRARQVGHALSALPSDTRVPWHRVVNAQGKVSPRIDGRPADEIQRLRLEAEGVVFDVNGRISLKLFLWRPTDGPDHTRKDKNDDYRTNSTAERD